MIVCVVRVTGVEPAWYCYHKNLNLTRLPISPYPQILSDKFYTARTLRGQTHIFSHKCFTAEVKLSFADIRLEALKRFLIRLINIANFIAFCQPFSWLYNAILKNYLYRIDKTDRVYISDFSKDSLSAVKITFSRITDNGFRHKSTAIKHVFRRRNSSFSNGKINHFPTAFSDILRRHVTTLFDGKIRRFPTACYNTFRQ